MNHKHYIPSILLLITAFISFSSKINCQLNSGFENPIMFDTVNFVPNWNIWLTNAIGMTENSSAFEGEKGLCVEPEDFNKPFSIDAEIHIPSYIFEKDNITFKLKVNSNDTELDSITFKVAQSGYNLYKSVKKEYSTSSISKGWINFTIPFQKLEANILQVRFIFRIYARHGHVKIDDFEVFSNEKSIETDRWRNFNENQLIEKLKSEIMPLDEFISSDVLKMNTTIGLGENSHGIKECKKLRYDIIKELSSKNDINVIIEQSPIEISILNNGLKGKSQEQIQKEINQLYFVYRSEYFQKLISNSADNLFQNQVSFFGIDMQYQNYDKEDLKRKNVHLLETEEEVIDRSITYFESYNSPIERIYQRDSLMAINTLTLIDNNLTNVILAHNQHLKNNGFTIGTKLNNQLHDKYLNIGILVGKGTHYTNDNYKEKKIHNMPPILPSSYESIFDKVSENPFVLNMNKIRKQKELYAQLCPRAMSTAGSVSQLSKISHVIIDLAEEYDYIIYYPQVEAMTPIGN